MSLALLLVYFVCAYTRPMDFFPDLASYRIMLWLGAICGVAAVGGVFLREDRPSLRTPQIFLMSGLLLAVALSRIAQGWLGGAVVALANFGTTAAVFFLIVLVVNSIRKLNALALVLVLCSLFLAGQSIAAYHFGYDEKRFVISQSTDAGDEYVAPADTESSDEDDDQPQLQAGTQDETQEQQADSADKPRLLRIRSVGFLADPNDFAQALLMVLPMLGLAWRSERTFRNLLVVLIPGLILLYAVYLTHSRGALVGLVVMLFMVARQRWGILRAILVAAVPGVLGVLLRFSGGRSFSLDESNTGRLDAWSAGLGMVRQQPFFGVGFGLFTEHNEITAHNSFVLCFAELGLFGYFFWLALLLITGYQLVGLLREPGGTEEDQAVRRWAGVIQMSFCGFLGTALFLSRTYNVGLYIMLGFTVVLVEVARRMEHPVRIPAFPSWFAKVGVLEVASIVAVYGLIRVFHVLR